jgi:lysophospholipase L1-like esterase
MKHWVLAYGTNDSAGNTPDASHFKHNLQTLVDRVREARRIPIVPRIPIATDHQHETIPLFNLAIDEVTSENSLMAGPDLYGWFSAHREELRDGIHPSDEGIVSINRLWADAVWPLYRR